MEKTPYNFLFSASSFLQYIPRSFGIPHILFWYTDCSHPCRSKGICFSVQTEIPHTSQNFLSWYLTSCCNIWAAAKSQKKIPCWFLYPDISADFPQDWRKTASYKICHLLRLPYRLHSFHPPVLIYSKNPALWNKNQESHPSLPVSAVLPKADPSLPVQTEDWSEVPPHSPVPSRNHIHSAIL